ncbi:hypothetical protein [Streptomyces flavidovirens]
MTLFLVIAAIVLGIICAIAKGLLHLLMIGIAVFASARTGHCGSR